VKNPELGKLEKVSLRKLWPNEAADFTPWLSKPENLKLLGESLGMELELEEIEQEVGPYSADLLLKDIGGDGWVVVENQIEKTNHNHLGQVLTYAAGLGAKTLVWIAAEFTEQHRSVLDWLNENTLEEVSVFGIELEALRIGESPPAVRFNVISKPNNWSKTARSRASGEELSPHRELQFEFWTAFKAWTESHAPGLHLQRPKYRSSLHSSLGRTGIFLNTAVSIWNSVTNTDLPEVRVELVLNSRESKSHFELLEKHRDEIERKIDIPLSWYNPENTRTCKIFVRRDGDFLDRRNWPELHQWLAKYLGIFRDIFANMAREL
jgi:hypothetical protein